jgi:polysaccharide pyruvyl transferase WcaK-like protein
LQRELKNWQFKLNELDNAIILQDSEVDQGTSSRAMQNSSQVMALRHWRFMRNLFKDPETTIWTLF